jgi:hypothetical protein
MNNERSSTYKQGINTILPTVSSLKSVYFQCCKCVRHVTGTGTGLLGEIPRVVVQKSALL